MAAFAGSVKGDRKALETLFHTTGGSGWKNNKGWCTDPDLSRWYGVTVNEHGRVEELCLGYNNLRGNIPAELHSLSALRKLALALNELSGQLPKELGKLSGLRSLSAFSNALNGPIPEEVGGMTALEVLWLSENLLSGAIPAGLGCLKQLKELKLGGNKLIGAIPAGLGHLKQLTTLKFGGNRFTGAVPLELGQLDKLKHLSVAANKLEVFPRALAEGLAAMGTPEVRTEGNPWKEPPADVLEKGMAYAARFFRDLEDYGSTKSNQLKVVLVGMAEAGKTSVAICLEGLGAGRLPSVKDRTVGVEIRDLRFGQAPKLDVKLWDFAGQQEYYDTHQMFLTQDALFVLTVDTFAYSEDGHSREDAIEQWLDILQCRVPGSVVLLVGTHGDLFASSAEREQRVEYVQRDVEEIVHRIRADCDSAAERAKELAVREGQDDTRLLGNRRYRPLRVVLEEEFLAMNLASSGSSNIDQLRALIENAAYDDHGGYMFPSVGTELPRAHALAFSMLEAVRRGVDLRGSGGDPATVAQRLSQGDPERERPFIRYSEALSLFLELASEQDLLSGIRHEEFGDTSERIFLQAVEFHESRGAILLTGMGGVGGKAHGNVASDNLVIHVNPAWFADLVRRVVDIRLLDPERQEKVAEVLETHAPLDSLRELSNQHRRFFRAGEVSRDYLKLLWLRDMELGPTSKGAPPLQMSEEEISAMVEGLVDVRFMFRVRNVGGGVVPDRYVVASCLPAHIGYAIDPASMLDLTEGGAIFSSQLKLVGARAMPPGLVPRLLAWCGRGDARITACWKHGVCFAFNREYLVLLYERGGAARFPVLECHVRGSAHDEKAGGTLSDVIAELDRLVRDDKYGFPGVGVFETKEIEKQTACSDDELEALLARLEGALGDHMNLKVAELLRKSDQIAGCMRDLLHGAEERMKSFERHAETALGKMKEDVFSKLDFIGAVASKCLLVSVEADNPCPRLIRVEEDVAHTQTSSRVSHFRRAIMDPFRRKLGKPKAQQSKPRRYRVRFLCAYDMSAADCGPDGKGYIIETEKDWQRWLRKCLPLVQVSLWLVRVGLSVVARADILPVEDMIGKLREVAGEEAAAYIDAIELTSFQAREVPLSARTDTQKEVFGQAYKSLVEFVQKEEDGIEVTTTRDVAAGQAATVGGGSTSREATGVAPSATSSAAPMSTVIPLGKRSFETDMVLESRQRGTDAPEWAWVRRVNLGKWQQFEAPAALPAGVTMP